MGAPMYRERARLRKVRVCRDMSLWGEYERAEKPLKACREWLAAWSPYPLLTTRIDRTPEAAATRCSNLSFAVRLWRLPIALKILV